MKRILLFLSALFIATTAIAHTIHWYVGDSVYHTTTCESGENVTPPTAPEKYGYTFRGWDPYFPIKYLESTGTQYIDTGIQQSDYAQNLIINMTLQFIEKSSQNASLGCMQTGSYFTPFQAGTSSSDFVSNVGAAGTEIIFNVNEPTGKHKIVCDTKQGMLTVDENVYTYKDNSAKVDKNIYMFARNNNGSPAMFSKIRFYNISFYTKEGNLIRDFIPVLDKYGTPCMYDKVEHKFYYNAGTGDFIAGPIIGE